MTASTDQAHAGPDSAGSAYPDSHLSKSARLGNGSPTTKLLLSILPLTVLAIWFGYMWFVSGVIPGKEKYAGGAIKAEGYLKRESIGEYVRHGHWTTYHENGAKSGEGSYDMGEKQGDWKYWDESGHLLDAAPVDSEPRPQGTTRAD